MHKQKSFLLIKNIYLSESLTLCVLHGAEGAVALQSHWVVVERGDVGQAARQPGRHVSDAAVGADAVVSVDVRGLDYRSLQSA